MLKVRDGQIKGNNDDECDGDGPGGEERAKVYMTSKIIAFTVNYFFMVGYFTVSNLLTDCMCFLALYPDVQLG
jgi:hypothetical protein